MCTNSIPIIQSFILYLSSNNTYNVNHLNRIKETFMNIHIKSFQELSNETLYQIMKSRLSVFVLEQHCMDEDLDNYDQTSMHCYIEEKGKIIAYCRLLPEDTKYEMPSIGRVLVNAAYRKRGIATKLLTEAVRYIEKTWEPSVIKVQAQAHLEKLYQALGFETVSEIYEDVGIPHIDMIKTVQK